MSGWLAKLFGNPEKDAKKLELPSELEFLKVSAIISAIIMITMFLILSLVLGPAVVEANYSDGVNYVVWSIMQGVWFAVGIEIILTGVRMFIGQSYQLSKVLARKSFQDRYRA